MINNASHNASGLTPNTQYYFHVRAYCGSSSTGPWATISFKTDAVCYAVTGLASSAITQNGATFSWNADPDAIWYEYITTTTSNPPGTSLAGSGTSKTNYTSSHLAPGSIYYFHVRKKCNNLLLSPWVTEQFTTSDLPTSAGDLKDELFAIYPNPTTGRFNMEWDANARNSEIQITITDVFGKQVRSFSTKQEKAAVDLTDQPLGLYFIRCSAGDRTYVKQVVVSR